MLVLHFNILARLKNSFTLGAWGQEFYFGRGEDWCDSNEFFSLSQQACVDVSDLKIASVPQTKLLLPVHAVCVMQLYWNSLDFYWSCCASLPMKNVRVSVLVVSNRSSRGVRDRSVFRFSPRPAGAFEGCRKYLWYAKAMKRRGCFTARRCSPGSQVEVPGEKKNNKTDTQPLWMENT